MVDEDRDTGATRGVGIEIRHHFDEVLGQIQRGLVEMGSLVLENVRRAGDAMLEAKLDEIEVVKAADYEVNRRYSDLEHLTFETLAREQPVASDLRFLVSASRILYELERSGDLAVNCVKVLERQEGFPDRPRLIGMLDQLLSASCSVFASGIDFLADMSADAGAILDAADDEVDQLVSQFYREIARVSDDIGLEASIGLSRVGRFLERIADHAVNIAEHVTYIVTAAFPADEHDSDK